METRAGKAITRSSTRARRFRTDIRRSEAGSLQQAQNEHKHILHMDYYRTSALQWYILQPTTKDNTGSVMNTTNNKTINTGGKVESEVIIMTQGGNIQREARNAHTRKGE